MVTRLTKAVAKLKALINARAFDADSVLADEAGARQLLGRFLWGDPDEVIARVHGLIALGLASDAASAHQ